MPTTADPFEGIATQRAPGGPPVPSCATAWASCELAFNLDLEADAILYVGRIVAARVG